jgi:hypothetical protein
MTTGDVISLDPQPMKVQSAAFLRTALPLAIDMLDQYDVDRYGKSRYSTSLFTDIGQDLDALREEFRPFRERFGVEIETRT